MKGITKEEATRTSMTGPLRFIEILTSMPLSGKLLFLVILALIPRIIVFLQPQIITIDGTLYIKMAKLFSEGQYGGTPGSYFSLYPFLIFLVQKVVGDWELSGQLISITLGTLTVIPIFLLGRSLYNERIGWLSGLFYITLPNLLRFDSQVIRDPSLWFFITFTIWLVWEGNKQNRPVLFALASLSAGLGALTRVEGFILWGVLGLYVVFRRGREASFKRKTLNLSLFILIFPLLLSIIPFSFKKESDKMAYGEMISFSFNFITAHGRTLLNPQDPIVTMGEKTYFSLPMISQDSLELASRHRVSLAVSEVIYKFIKSGNLLILLIVLGIWKRKKEGFGFSDRYLLYIFAALFLMSIFYARQIYYFSTRHGLILVLPCFFFAGHGLDFIAERFSRGLDHLASRWNIIRKYLIHFLTLIIIILFLVQGFSFKRSEKFIQKEIGLWLKEKGYQGSVIMGPRNLHRLAFYADGKFLEMPDSWEKAIQSIRESEVKIVVVDSCTIDQDCPDFLENWSRAGLFQVKAFKTEKEKCMIQIHGGP